MPRTNDAEIALVRNLAGRFLGAQIHYCNIRGFGTLASITMDGQCVIEYPDDITDCVHYSDAKMLNQAAQLL